MSGAAILLAEYTGTSYDTPYYTLPWNYFSNRPMQKLPFYQQTVLDALAIRTAQSPKNYDAMVQLRVLVPTTIPSPLNYSTLNAVPSTGSIAYQSATNSLVGLNCGGVDQGVQVLSAVVSGLDFLYPGDQLHTYNVNGQITGVSEPIGGNNYIQVIAINLDASQGFYNVDLANQPCPSTVRTLGGTFAGITIDNVQPLNPTNPFVNPQEYLVTGNRLWIFVSTTSPIEGTANYSLTFNVIERPNPQTIAQLATIASRPAQCAC